MSHYHFHFYDKAPWVESDHPRNKGRFAEKGHEAEGFVSPNEGNIDLKQAVKELHSKRQQALKSISPEIDRLCGIDDSETHSVLGVWKTGAEHSTVCRMHNTTPERAELALAMKGFLANQLQVLSFVPGKGGEYMVTYDAKGTPEEIHQSLDANHVEFHTLEPTEGGAKVHVYGSDQETLDNVAKAAGESQLSIIPGKGKFIGTHKDTGTDEEQRADARQQYSRIIARAVASGKLKGDFGSRWDGIRRRWHQTADKSYSRRVRVSDHVVFHWVTHGDIQRRRGTAQMPGDVTRQWWRQGRYPARP